MIVPDVPKGTDPSFIPTFSELKQSLLFLIFVIFQSFLSRQPSISQPLTSWQHMAKHSKVYYAISLTSRNLKLPLNSSPIFQSFPSGFIGNVVPRVGLNGYVHPLSSFFTPFSAIQESISGISFLRLRMRHTRKSLTQVLLITNSLSSMGCC